jgi:hypothetical protein
MGFSPKAVGYTGKGIINSLCQWWFIVFSFVVFLITFQVDSLIGVGVFIDLVGVTKDLHINFS